MWGCDVAGVGDNSVAPRLLPCPSLLQSRRQVHSCRDFQLGTEAVDAGWGGALQEASGF